MTNILLIFLKGIIEDIVGEGGFIDTAIDFAFDKLAHNTFYIEDSIGLELDGTFNFDTLMSFVMGFAVILIILKYLKKGFDTYIAWTDDPTADPIVLTTGLLKALVVALSFPILYDWLCEVVEDLTNGLLKSLSLENVGVDIAQAIINMISSKGLVFIIFLLVFIILFIVLYVKFLMRAAELFIVRVGFPLACVGLIDSNGGVFTGYVNKMFQTVLSVTVQITLAKMSIVFLLGSHLIWAIVFMLMAIKSPNILRDLIYTPGGGGGGISNAYHAMQMVKSFVKK